MLKIVSAPNSVLSQSAKRISKIDTKILRFIEEMEKALLSAKDPGALESIRNRQVN